MHLPNSRRKTFPTPVMWNTTSVQQANFKFQVLLKKNQLRGQSAIVKIKQKKSLCSASFNLISLGNQWFRSINKKQIVVNMSMFSWPGSWAVDPFRQAWVVGENTESSNAAVVTLDERHRRRNDNEEEKHDETTWSHFQWLSCLLFSSFGTKFF